MWNESIPAPSTAFINLSLLYFDGSAWNRLPASLTIPSGVEAETPALYLSVPGSRLINDGMLTCAIGIRNYGSIEGSGTVNASGQTRQVIEESNRQDKFTAHGDAIFHAGFTTIGTTDTNGITTKSEIIIPAGTSLTIPKNVTLDATAKGTITTQITEPW